MKNIELRRELIRSGKFSYYLKVRREVYESADEEVRIVLENDDDFAEAVYGMKIEEIRECEKMRKCCMQQSRKVMDHLKFLFEGQWHLYWVTYTFTDEVLDNTKPKTRKEKIIRIQSKYCDDFITNIDFSPDIGREHFHSVIAVLDSFNQVYFNDEGFLRLEFLDREYKYGFYKVEIIKTSGLDAKRIAKYVTKLTLHSIKVAQSYISVKKGSPYQKYKELVKEMKRDSRAPGRLFQKDFEDEVEHLLSGNASSGKEYEGLKTFWKADEIAETLQNF